MVGSLVLLTSMKLDPHQGSAAGASCGTMQVKIYILYSDIYIYIEIFSVARWVLLECCSI